MNTENSLIFEDQEISFENEKFNEKFLDANEESKVSVFELLGLKYPQNLT